MGHFVASAPIVKGQKTGEIGPCALLVASRSGWAALRQGIMPEAMAGHSPL